MAIKHGTLKAAVDEIAKENGGRVTPLNVVEAACDPDHPLHNEFDWDDASAAHKHRLAQAAALLRRIEYVGRDVEGREVTAVGYVYDPPTQSHIPLSVVARNKQQSRNLMMQELIACESHIRRAQRICDVLRLRGELDKLLHDCIGVIERMKSPPKHPPRPASRRSRGGEARPSA